MYSGDMSLYCFCSSPTHLKGNDMLQNIATNLPQGLDPHSTLILVKIYNAVYVMNRLSKKYIVMLMRDSSFITHHYFFPKHVDFQTLTAI